MEKEKIIYNNDEKIGKFLIIEYIGGGHFGSVYKVNDTGLDCIKAIKILKPENPEDFKYHLDEARVLEKCKHKNIVEVNGVDIYHYNDEDLVIIDMELIDGPSLEKLQKEEYIGLIECVRYIIDVLFGLEHAHLQDILHRDIKPANIMIDNGNAKLSDFGLATYLEGCETGSSKVYNPHAAPECFTEGVTSVRTDIFAVGLTLFRLVNDLDEWRKDFWNLENVTDILISGKVIKAMGYNLYVPKQLRKIINKSCNPDNKKRYKSAMEMRRALENLRFNIDWVQTGQYEFNGRSYNKKDKFEIEVNQKNNFVLKRNNRKVTSEMRKFDLRDDALAYMYEYVYNTTFK